MGSALNAVKSVANVPLGVVGMSTNDAQGNYYQPQYQNAQNNAFNSFANDYSGQKNAADAQVQNGALTSGVYGAGGLQSELTPEEHQLSSQGFNLTSGDQQAYGQAAGNIARQFGQQDQATAQQLARRGLASASSGAAGAAFSGNQGNKNEMLAKAQTDIAQKRMADTQNRLMANRNLQAQLASSGNAMSNENYNQKGNALMSAANNENRYNQQFNQGQQASLQDQRAANKPGLFSAIGQNIQSGIGQGINNAASKAVGGGMNSMFGGN